MRLGTLSSMAIHSSSFILFKPFSTWFIAIPHKRFFASTLISHSVWSGSSTLSLIATSSSSLMSYDTIWLPSLKKLTVRFCFTLIFPPLFSSSDRMRWA